ncbi:DNA binding domain-containing protein, excisionase family [Streptomyces sp. cf386]|uniref:helix-turn-helix domain-containing protein n=1 Tax=Streptomyces sp. cf386 TaxID=1761904 RepID=UPI00088B3E85|nr:DNA binding domain-containing protein, excisionase family [Streptomyces sp. cf386]
MAILGKPDLPEGAHRSLNRLLHSIHVRAGMPSCRQMEKEVNHEKEREPGGPSDKTWISRSTIHDAFSSARLPALEVVYELVDLLTRRGPLANPERAAINRRLMCELWVRAAERRQDGGGAVSEGAQPSETLGTACLPRGSSLRDVVYLTPVEAALLLDLSKQAVYRMIHSGQLQAIRVGRTYRIPDVAVREMENSSFLHLHEPPSPPNAN